MPDTIAMNDFPVHSDVLDTDKFAMIGTSEEFQATAANTAKHFLEEYEGSTFGGESQTVKDALDTLIPDVETLKEQVANIEEEEGLYKYGVSGIGQSAAALTRIWDSVGMTAQVGTDGDNSNVVNTFDHATPFNRKKCVGSWSLVNGKAHFTVNAYYGDSNYAEDGTMGDYVAVECPRAYYILDGDRLGVSAHQYEGWRPFDIFCVDHNPEETLEKVYLPAYALAVDANNKAVCLPGLDNLSGAYKTLLDAARTYDSAASANAVLMPMAVNFYEWAMFTVEFATQDAQTVMMGCTNLRSDAGDTCTFRDSTHIITSNYQAGRVAGEFILISNDTVDTNGSHYASHRIVEVTRCDASGNASASGSHQLIKVVDLGKGYVEYDTSTEYTIVARPYQTGSCNSVSTPSGSPGDNTSGYYPMKYRWRENLYGNQYHTVTDLFALKVGTSDSDYSLDWYYLPSPEDYTPSSTSNPDATDFATSDFTKLDVSTAHENYASGYIKSKKYSAEYPDIWIPYETTGGSASTYFADQATLVSTNVNRAVRLGGSWRSGRSAGLSSLTAFYAPSFAYATYGGDLCFTSQG